MSSTVIEKTDLLEFQDAIDGIKRDALTLRLAVVGLGTISGDKDCTAALEQQALGLVDQLKGLSRDLQCLREGDTAGEGPAAPGFVLH